MTNIPFTAIGAAFTPVQRATNELLRARKVQSDKDSHHTEDVEELDDTAVNSVDERKQGGGGGRKDSDAKRQDEPEERVEIAALSESWQNPTVKFGKSRSQLDISA